MMRGGNRNTRRMIDKMGLDLQEIPNVQKVIIQTDKKEMVFSKPQVSEMEQNNKTIFTVVADSYEEKELDVPIFEDGDIDLVCQQAGTGRERAIEALTESNGDLAQAILLLK